MQSDHKCPFCKDAYLDIVAWIKEPSIEQEFLVCPHCENKTFSVDLDNDLVYL